MFRVRYFLGLVSALTLVLAASGLAPRLASAQEEDEFDCPTENICFYAGEFFNKFEGLPDVVAFAPSAAEVCHGLEWGDQTQKGVPFLAGSVRNNTGARLVLFADDNCRTPVGEPTGGALDAQKSAHLVKPKARSYEAVNLPVEPEATTQQVENESGELASDGVAVLKDGWNHLLDEQGAAAQTRRKVIERSSDELDHESARARRLERLVRGIREGREPPAPVGAGLQQLGPDLDADRQPHSARLPGDMHEVEQGVDTVHVLGG